MEDNSLEWFFFQSHLISDTGRPFISKIALK